MCNQGYLRNNSGEMNDSTTSRSNDNANLTTHRGNSESSDILYDNISGEENSDPNGKLDNLRKNNHGRLIIGHLNINSLRNKFEALKFLIQGKVDIFVVSETKLDESFPRGQFAIEGYSTPIRFDRNNEGGGIIIYVRSDIPCKVIKYNLPNNIEGIFIELNLRKKKWILFGGYNPNKVYIQDFLNQIGKALDKFIGTYDNLLLVGDFNSETEEEYMKDFCDLYNLKNLIKHPTCYKNVLNPTSIDMFLTNRHNCFQNSCTIETGISDHHRMIITVLKTYFKKLKPSIIKYRSYANFDEDSFKTDLAYSLYSSDKCNMKYDEFKNIFMNALNRHAPIKEKKD